LDSALPTMRYDSSIVSPSKRIVTVLPMRTFRRHQRHLR
jgi:hypothetical protein